MSSSTETRFIYADEITTETVAYHHGREVGVEAVRTDVQRERELGGPIWPPAVTTTTWIVVSWSDGQQDYLPPLLLVETIVPS